MAQKIVESACGYDFELKRLDLKGENIESLIEGFSININLGRMHLSKGQNIPVLFPPFDYEPCIALFPEKIS